MNFARPLRSGTAILAALASVGVLGFALDAHREQADRLPAADSPRGYTVVDERGRPVQGAVARFADGGSQTTDAGGGLTVDGRAGELVALQAPGFNRRVTVMDPGSPRVTLAHAAGTVSLRLGGDVMFGRRFYESQDREAPLLRAGADGESHAALLRHVRPLLEDADITAVNLETVLVPRPQAALQKVRDPRFHRSKNIIVASAPEAAAGLKAAGVDVVDLGNNHVYDALEPGVAQTVAALDAAGLPHYGAGRTVDEAWRPAVLTVRGAKVAFIGCTAVTGKRLVTSYVAERTKGGAAECTQERLTREVQAARRAGARVVVSIHGGTEYVREQSAEVRRLTTAAEQAGATVVANSHPHVVGRVHTEGRALVADTLGNLVFDQDLWSTSPAYLLRVELGADGVVAHSVDPLVMDGHVPWPARGPLGATVRQLADGHGPRDILFGSGSFEPSTDAADRAPLWSLGKYAEVRRDAACSGSRGVRLLRSPVSEADVVATHDHRAQVQAGQRYEVSANVRFASAGASLEVRWYHGMEGGSSSTERIAIAPQPRTAPGECTRVAQEVTVPSDAEAAQVFVRLDAPADVQMSSELSVDDVAMTPVR